MATFKKTPIAASRVAAAQQAAAASPIVEDPRSSAALPEPTAAATAVKAAPQAEFGARQISPETAAPVYRTGQVYEVPLSEVRANPLNPRVIYTSTALDEMAMSLANEGQQVAATAFVDEDGRVTLIDGEKRLRAARLAGLVSLRVELRPAPSDKRALYEAARNTNLQRSGQSPLDDALRWKDMLSKEVYPSQGALALALAVTGDIVSRTLSLAQFPQRILHALSEEPELLKLRMLNALREFWEACSSDERDEMTLDLIAEVARKGLGYREVEARRKALGKGPVAKPRAITEPFKLGSARGELKTFPDGRLELSFKGLDEAQSDKLRLELAQAIRAMAPQHEAV